MRWNMYRKMLVFATAMIILPVSLLGYLTFLQSETLLVTRMKQTSRLTMENAANYFIKHYIGETETVLNILTSDPALLEISETEHNAKLLLSNWEQYRRYSENIWHISYGTAQGNFFITPHWELPKDYDPRVRPWYQASTQGWGIVWSEPFVDAMTNNMVVAATKTIYKDGQIRGVFGIHTSLNILSAIIGNIKIGPGGYLILIDGQGNIIAHNELALLGTNVRHTLWFEQLAQAEYKPISVDVQGSKIYVSGVGIPKTGWTLVGFLPEAAFASEVAPIKVATLFVAFIGIFFASLISAVASKRIAVRLQHLITDMAKIEKGNFELAINDCSTDEIGQLNRKFLKMAERIKMLMQERDLTEAEIRRQKSYFAQLFENSPESIAILDSSDRVVNINRHFEEFFQFTAQEAEGKPIDDLVVPPHLLEENIHFSNSLSGKETVQAETVRRRKDGSLVEVQVIAYPIIIDDCVRGTYAIYRDISERKAAERQLEYMTYHDVMTGVYNRAYFEQQIERISLNEAGSFGILICDVDGLKLVNDSFGHARGDELLKTAALLIKAAVPPDSLIARIGGDEFSILLTEAGEVMLQEVMRKLQNRIEDFNTMQQELTVSLSIGYAAAETGKQIDEAFQEADSRMYKEKLHRGQSARSAIVKTLMHALHARDFITEGHADRMQDMVEKLARRVGVAEYKIQDFRLLAQFHDIGKVGIPDSILFKPGALDENEFDIMRRHSEIGYRIAISSPELNHIADWILKHHERWNGTGYPIGLSGGEIPIECRVLAICDAYDAMTSERPYKKAISCQTALEEIERCSGTMFDPEIARIFIAMAKEDIENTSE